MPEKHNTERRKRYTKAVEQLGNEKAPVRMGGVYTLVSLVDEWLREENIEYNERIAEGQIIINKLCAYICSPFALASHYNELTQESPTAEGLYKNREQDFYIDKAEFKSEADIRLSIIKEIHSRLQSPKINTPGAWSDFEYDFSGSTFFYPIDLTNSYYTKPVNFSGSTYQGDADFESSTYQSRADFSDSTYRCWADFRSSTYQSEANFSGSTYQDGATFNGSTYTGWANFNCSTYQEGAYFNSSTYQSEVYFNSSIYWEGTYFNSSTYTGWADFNYSTYQSEVYFNDSTYQGKADFSDSTYKSWAYFSDSTYENETNFSGSIFYQETYFGEDGYSNSSSCFTNHAPQFYDKKKRKNTLFGSPNNDFTVDIDKGYPIDLDSKGIPLNCKFLTSEQKEYLEGKLQEIEKINNKLFEVKDLAKKTELSEKLRSLNEELYEWREEVTTVKMEDVAAEDTKS